jgi:hypothetical protein
MVTALIEAAGNSGQTQTGMKHPDIIWNAETKEWFCIRCFRTSDHVTKLNAENELSYFDCVVPDTDGDGEEFKNRAAN